MNGSFLGFYNHNIRIGTTQSVQNFQIIDIVNLKFTKWSNTLIRVQYVFFLKNQFQVFFYTFWLIIITKSEKTLGFLYFLLQWSSVYEVAQQWNLVIMCNPLRDFQRNLLIMCNPLRDSQWNLVMMYNTVRENVWKLPVNNHKMSNICVFPPLPG